MEQGHTSEQPFRYIRDVDNTSGWLMEGIYQALAIVTIFSFDNF